MFRQEGACPGPETCESSPDDGSARCEGCLIGNLEDKMQSRAGQLLRSAFDLDYSLTCGFGSDLSEVSCLEFSVLKSIRYERDRFKAEQSKRT